MRALAFMLAASMVLAACARAPQATPIGPTRAAAALARSVAAPPAFSPREARALHDRLRTTLSASALATSGIEIVDSGGHSLFERRARTPFAPASTLKVLAAMTALHVLGPTYRYETTFEALDDPLDGTIAGDLYLIGTGDPTLRADDVRGGVGALARRGVQRITGNLVADASAFGGSEINTAWALDDLQYDYAAPTSALSLDEGTVELHVEPGSVGAPVRIDVHPKNDEVHVKDALSTGYSTSLSIDRAPTSNDFTASGTVAVGAEQSFYRPVYGLAHYTASAALQMLLDRKIAIAGPVRLGVAPVSARVLWQHRSPPLTAIVREMLYVSNNHFAEQLLRTVGARERGNGTEQTGGAVERAYLATLGVPTPGLRIVDGSGLAASNRIAPVTLATLLARVASDSRVIPLLPRVGLEGTVRHREVTTALGRVRAKSGHIENVNALAGIVQTRHHGRVAFAIIVNDRRADDGPVDDGIDRTLDVLAEE